MSGFVKPEPIDWEDTNVAKIGSAEDKDARKAAADTEPAWAGAGQEPGLKVWRIEKFEVKAWPEEQYGQFHKGDSYIVLHTYKAEEGDKLMYDIYFWLGLESTQDEQGTAAYKTVELDAFFNDAAVQHREVMMSESPEFDALFPKIQYLAGGVDTGFAHVEAGAYVAKLFQVKKVGKQCKSVEVKCARESLNQGDAFVLDMGEKIYIWKGESCSPFETNLANQFAEGLESERGGKSQATHDIDGDFWAALGGEGDITSAEDAASVLPTAAEDGEGILYKLSDTSGELTMEEVGRGELTKDMLGADDVYLLDTCKKSGVLVWIGSGASKKEADSAMSTATNYLEQTSKPFTTPVSVMKQGNENPTFAAIFAN